MVKELRFFSSSGSDPYENLAVEAFLLQTCPDDCAILYLWQNQNTVVIGKNQNPWKECDLPLMQTDGIRLARRKSGGGAVFHDLGNLNFTFLLPTCDYEVSVQLQIIASALETFGLNAEISGRNDLTVNGCKVSGSAFQKTARIGCHHGTLLVNSDLDRLSGCLRPSAEKLRSKGVESVRARVANLCTLCPDITVDKLSKAVLAAFCRRYGLSARPMSFSDLPAGEIRSLADSFSDPEWLYGRQIPFTWENFGRFGWGEITLRIHADCGRVSRVQFFSDTMDDRVLQLLPSLWEGMPFDLSALSCALNALSPADESIINDICSLLSGRA